MVRLVLTSLVLFALTAVLLFDALFDEPGARRVTSLVGELGCRSVLAVLAHPDDELLMAATLADAVKRGCQVRSVTASRGEGGIPKGFTGDSARLVEIREEELRRFGARLGMHSQTLWSFSDSRLTDVPIEVLRDSVLAAIRRYQPDLVLTLDPIGGFTGHPDHRRIGQAAALAAWQAHDSLPAGAPRPRWLAQVVFPRRAALLVPRSDTRGRLRAQPRADIAASGDRRIKQLGMKIHASQAQYFPPEWSRPLLYAFFDREHFALTRLTRDGESAAPKDSTSGSR